MAAAKNLTKQQLTLRASRAAHIRWASEDDPAAAATAGQRGLRDRFDREAREATPGLSDAEYERRAGHLYQAHMAGLAFKSSKARSRRAVQDTPAS